MYKTTIKRVRIFKENQVENILIICKIYDLKF